MRAALLRPFVFWSARLEPDEGGRVVPWQGGLHTPGVPAQVRQHLLQARPAPTCVVELVLQRRQGAGSAAHTSAGSSPGVWQGAQLFC